MTGPTPLLEFFKKGEVARDVRLLAAQGGLGARAHEQLAILIVLVGDADPDVRAAATASLDRIPLDALKGCLARPDTSAAIREFFAARGVVAGDTPASEADDPIVPLAAAASAEQYDEPQTRETAVQQIAKMGFTERLKTAVKGTREMRSILVRDANKMIAVGVLSSPKLSEPEIESIARMTNVSDEVLRVIGGNRAWTKNYGILLALVKNPKTPVAMSLNMMNRLNDRDLNQLSVDRNVPEPLRVAARKKVVSNTSGRT